MAKFTVRTTVGEFRDFLLRFPSETPAAQVVSEFVEFKLSSLRKQREAQKRYRAKEKSRVRKK